MKNIIVLSLMFAGLMSCMDDTHTVGDGLGEKSDVVYFPVVKLKGEQIMIVNAGSPFTDPGVETTVAGKPVTHVITGAVDTNKPALYRLKYTAENSLGYSASKVRLVIVKNASPVAPDYSGQWTRNAGAKGTSTWIQLTSFSYAVSDPGGAGKGDNGDYTNFWVEATVTNGVPAIKSQKASQQIGATLVDVNTKSETAFSGTTPGSTYSWALITTGFGAGDRTFVKQ